MAAKDRVAIIGGGLGGLSAAGALAKAGCDVTVFEAAPQLGGKAGSVQARGVVLDTGPTLLTMPAVVRRTFESLNATDLLPRFVELSHQCSYVFGDACRFDAFRDLERTAQSAAELRPVERHGVFSFYDEARAIYRAAGEPWLEAPFEGITDFMSRTLRRGVGAVVRGMGMPTLQALGEKHFKTDHLRQFVGRFATYAGASPWKASAAFAVIPWIEHAEGVHHVTGGIGALSKALAEAVQRQGVRVRLGVKASWSRTGESFQVVADDSGGEFDALVVNADPLASSGRGDEELSLSGYVLLLSVPKRLSLPHHTVRFSSDYPNEFAELFSGRLPADPTIYVCHPAASDPSMAEEGRSGLFVMVNAPPLSGDHARDEALWRDAAPRLRERCLVQVEALAPGAGASAEVIAERTPRELMRIGAPRGSIYGFLPHGKLAPFRRPRIRGEVPGLFFAGGGTHPGGGVPMVMLSGRFAAELTLEHLRGGVR